MKATTSFLMILTLCLPFMVSAQSTITPPEVAIDCVVIDAGHGGKDPGCSWGGNLEKDLNLRVALRLGGMIEQAYPEVKVIYTRKDDRFIELHERGDIANRADADLFISIHTDAVDNTAAHGSSTFIMGNDKSEKNLAVAQRENSVIVLEGDYEAKYEGYDPSSAESFIIFSLMQYAHAEQSMIFAEMVQKHYKLNTPITDRGARQAPYLVLWRTAMPAVLTELGFMTNKNDRDYLLSEEGEKAVSKALFDAFGEYLAKCNAKAGLVTGQPKSNNIQPLGSANNRATTEKAEQKAEVKDQPESNPKEESQAKEVGKPESNSKEESQAKEAGKPKSNPKEESQAKEVGKPKSNPKEESQAKEAGKPKSNPKEDSQAKEAGKPKSNPKEDSQAKEAGKPKSNPKEDSQAKEAGKPKSNSKEESQAKEVIRLYVQICTLSAKSDPNDKKFGIYQGRIVQKQAPNGKWRCMVAAKDLQQAKQIAAEADKNGFKGAYVVAYEGNTLIPLSQAVKRLK